MPKIRIVSKKLALYGMMTTCQAEASVETMPYLCQRTGVPLFNAAGDTRYVEEFVTACMNVAGCKHVRGTLGYGGMN